MYRVYFDSGTTNTRAYLMDGSQIIARNAAQIGSRNSALQGSNAGLIGRLKQMYDELLQEKGLEESDIDSIWMSGMISCPHGLVEIPHIPVPLSLEQLKSHVASYYEEHFFKREIRVIPGIKTVPADGAVSFENISGINNMRGEETELFGIAGSVHELPSDCVILMPGSHTQAAFIRDGAITDILSTVTGELYQAIRQETILSSSLPDHAGPKDMTPQLICRGCRDLETYGFNRALYIVRTMDLFLECTAYERLSYLEGVLNGGVLTAVMHVLKEKQLPGRCIAVYGSGLQHVIFRELIKEFYPKFEFLPIAESAVPFSVEGFLQISNGKRNYP